MPWSGFSLTACPSLDVVLRHDRVRTQVYDVSGSEHNFMTYLGRNTVLRLGLVVTQFYNMYGRNTVLPHTRVGTQFYDLPRLGRSYLTCHGHDTVYGMPGQNTVLRYALVRTQFYDMPGQDTGLRLVNHIFVLNL